MGRNHQYFHMKYIPGFFKKNYAPRQRKKPIWRHVGAFSNTGGPIGRGKRRNTRAATPSRSAPRFAPFRRQPPPVRFAGNRAPATPGPPRSDRGIGRRQPPDPPLRGQLSDSSAQVSFALSPFPSNSCDATLSCPSPSCARRVASPLLF